MRYCPLFIMPVFLLACTRPVYQSTASDEVEWANEEIDVHRMVKAYLIEMHPYETAVEATLLADPRVVFARFAFPVTWFRGSSFPDGMRRSYGVVVTTVEPMAASEATGLLLHALQLAGLRHAGEPRITVDGNRWTVKWGSAIIGEDGNPDITILNTP
jgi:hypothetical protein